MKKLIEQLQNIALDGEFLFQKRLSKTDISKPVELKDLLFRKTERFMGYAAGDDLPFKSFDHINGIDFYAHKATYTTLGVLLFELLFSDQRYLEVQITQSQSQIKQFFIYLDRENRHYTHTELPIGQKETYTFYRYFSQAVDKFPLSSLTQRGLIADALPHFGLGCSDYHSNFKKDYAETADQLILTLTVTTLVQLAELFLDIGRIYNETDEICLENPLYGFGGVNERSIEIRFWLPDSFGFYTDDINDLKF